MASESGRTAVTSPGLALPSITSASTSINHSCPSLQVHRDVVSPLHTQHPLSLHKTRHTPLPTTSTSRSSYGKLSIAKVCSRSSTVTRSSHANLYICRSISILSRSPLRPSLSPPTSTTTISPSEPGTSSSFFPLSQPAMQQIRGMKRNTYNPSHVVRKRRHGYLSRIKTRTGRMTLKRRRMKKRSTLSH